jgi:hypothetical protein
MSVNAPESASANLRYAINLSQEQCKFMTQAQKCFRAGKDEDGIRIQSKKPDQVFLLFSPFTSGGLIVRSGQLLHQPRLGKTTAQTTSCTSKSRTGAGTKWPLHTLLKASKKGQSRKLLRGDIWPLQKTTLRNSLRLGTSGCTLILQTNPCRCGSTPRTRSGRNAPSPSRRMMGTPGTPIGSVTFFAWASLWAKQGDRHTSRRNRMPGVPNRMTKVRATRVRVRGSLTQSLLLLILVAELEPIVKKREARAIRYKQNMRRPHVIRGAHDKTLIRISISGW